MKILVTGGAGYIGSHTSVQLLQAGHDIVIADSLINSKEEVIRRIKKLARRDFTFYPIDLCDDDAVNDLFAKEQLDAVIHFAGLKAVGESVEQPLRYYQNNLISTLRLLEAMNKHGVKNLVFSSSATVYGVPETVPITEDFPLSTTNPYGTTKLMIEQILKDVCAADPGFNCILLRYFNPVGAHPSGLIGEDPGGIPNNLIPYILQVAVGRLEKLRVFGGDYPTPDGTGVRDYIHVEDLAAGHLAALARFSGNHGLDIYNLGTGRGYSVLEMVRAFEKVTGREIPYEMVARRPGDVATCYANAQKAQRELGWRAHKTLEDMCEDAWRWQVNNPNGY